MTTRLSSLQYPMLRMFADSPDDYMSLDTARKFDQRPFRSMLMRGWVRYVKGRGFHLTKEGKDAWYEFQHHTITRKNPELPLTAYFDPTAYGIRPRSASVVPVRHAPEQEHQGAAA